MRLGFWNRLAIVAGFLALLFVPPAIMVSINGELEDGRHAVFAQCERYAKTWAKQNDWIRYSTEDQRCWDAYLKDTPSYLGFSEWWELFYSTAIACIILYVLIFGIVATAKWVWRGRSL